MTPDQRHPGREAEHCLGLKQVFLEASANAPSSLPYYRFIPPALLPRSTASLHPSALDPAAASPASGPARILYNQDPPSAWSLSRHPGPWTADRTHMANQQPASAMSL